MNDKKNELKIKGLALFYMEEKTKVHIVLFNKRFYNGVVKSIREDKDNGDLLIVDDVKIGVAAIPLIDVEVLETYKNGDNTYIKQSYYQP